MASKTRHIGHSITFAVIIGATPIGAAVVNVDAINSEYYLSNGEPSGRFSKIITSPLGAEIVDSTEVDISGNIDADTTTDPLADRDADSDTDTQNQGLCDTRNNPVQTDSLHEDSVLIELCDSLKHEKIDNRDLKGPQFASSFRTAIAGEQIVNHYAQKPSHNNVSESSNNYAYRNINRLELVYSGGIEGGGISNKMIIMATILILIPATILMLAIGTELIRGRKSI